MDVSAEKMHVKMPFSAVRFSNKSLWAPHCWQTPSTQLASKTMFGVPWTLLKSRNPTQAESPLHEPGAKVKSSKLIGITCAPNIAPSKTEVSWQAELPTQAPALTRTLPLALDPKNPHTLLVPTQVCGPKILSDEATVSGAKTDPTPAQALKPRHTKSPSSEFDTAIPVQAPSPSQDCSPTVYPLPVHSLHASFWTQDLTPMVWLPCVQPWQAPGPSQAP